MSFKKILIRSINVLWTGYRGMGNLPSGGEQLNTGCLIDLPDLFSEKWSDRIGVYDSISYASRILDLYLISP